MQNQIQIHIRINLGKSCNDRINQLKLQIQIQIEKVNTNTNVLATADPEFYPASLWCPQEDYFIWGQVNISTKKLSGMR